MNRKIAAILLTIFVFLNFKPAKASSNPDHDIYGEYLTQIDVSLCEYDGEVEGRDFLNMIYLAYLHKYSPEEVLKLYKRHMSTYGEKSSLTRMDCIGVISDLLHLTEGVNKNDYRYYGVLTFPDLKELSQEDAFAAGEALAFGIIGEGPEGLFYPHENIRGEEVAAMAARLANGDFRIKPDEDSYFYLENPSDGITYLLPSYGDEDNYADAKRLMEMVSRFGVLGNAELVYSIKTIFYRFERNLDRGIFFDARMVTYLREKNKYAHCLNLYNIRNNNVNDYMEGAKEVLECVLDEGIDEILDALSKCVLFSEYDGFEFSTGGRTVTVKGSQAVGCAWIDIRNSEE